MSFQNWLVRRLSKAYAKMDLFSQKVDVSKLSQAQQTGLKIIKHLSSKAESEIIMDPITDKYYIKNTDIFIIIDRRAVLIINSKYSYDLNYDDRVYCHIVSHVRRVIGNRRASMESMIRAKIQHSLETIYTDLTNGNRESDIDS